MDGANRMAAQEEIFFICSFCTIAASFCRAVVSVESRLMASVSEERMDSSLPVTAITPAASATSSTLSVVCVTTASLSGRVFVVLTRRPRGR